MFARKRPNNTPYTAPERFGTGKKQEKEAVLAFTRSMAYTPGTNVKGNLTGANWTFLLPSMEVEHVVTLGVPGDDVIPVLARVGRRVTLLCPPRPEEDIGELRLHHRLLPLRPLVMDDWTTLPLEDQSVDVLVLVDRRAASRFFATPGWLEELQRVLKPDGVVYFEFGSWRPHLFDRFRSCPGTLQRFWVTPVVGGIKTAIPFPDPVVERFFAQKKLYAARFKRPWFAFERPLYEREQVRARVRRFGVLWTPSDQAAWQDGPPRYLCQLAQVEGIDLTGYRWALVATGDYSSRKVLFYLFPPETDPYAPQPEYLVKLTRDPQYNFRLENEARALRTLENVKFPGARVLPRIAFTGYHSSLAVAAQTVVPGVPFDAKTQTTPHCPYAKSAVNWLIELGSATVNTQVATSADVAQMLHPLVVQLADVYHLSARHRSFLEQQLRVLAASVRPFPLVFQHGDPGPWNVLVRPDGVPVFIDWESAEPLGMPLWDLWYFWRSFSLRVARQEGTRNRLKAFQQQFLSVSELSIRIVASVQRYCEQLGILREWVAPLFYLCWVHRALKEATRLPRSRLEKGHYINLLRLCIDGRDTLTLRRMFYEQP